MLEHDGRGDLMGAEAKVRAALLKEFGQAFVARRLQVDYKLNGETAYKRFDAVSFLVCPRAASSKPSSLAGIFGKTKVHATLNILSLAKVLLRDYETQVKLGPGMAI